MTTSQYITWLLNRTGNTISRADMLFNVNLAQNEIASIDSYFFRTKPDPYLVTTADTFTYTLAASVRRVARVYALSTNSNFSMNFTAYNGFSGSSDYNGGRYVDRLSSPEVNIPVDSIESSSPDSSDAQIIFPRENNPGTTTEVFLLEQYVWPTQLSSESISIQIPEGHQTKILYYKILRMLEEQEYGNAGYSAEREDKAMKDWMRFANRGARVVPYQTMPRDL